MKNFKDYYEEYVRLKIISPERNEKFADRNDQKQKEREIMHLKRQKQKKERVCEVKKAQQKEKRILIKKARASL